MPSPHTEYFEYCEAIEALIHCGTEIDYCLQYAPLASRRMFRVAAIVLVEMLTITALTIAPALDVDRSVLTSWFDELFAQLNVRYRPKADIQVGEMQSLSGRFAQRSPRTSCSETCNPPLHFYATANFALC